MVMPEYRIGQEVAYTMLTSDNPTRRDKLWHGIVEYIWVPTQCLKVRLLDEGYEGLPELVRFEQVIGPDMRHCEYCNAYHSVKALDEGWRCPLAPRQRNSRG